MPRNNRLMEPVKIGVAISRPSWVSDSPRSSAIRMPIMEKMVHTAKQSVKASVDRPSARCCWVRVGMFITLAILLCVFRPWFIASAKVSKTVFSVSGHWGYLLQGGLVVVLWRVYPEGGSDLIALVG